MSRKLTPREKEQQVQLEKIVAILSKQPQTNELDGIRLTTVGIGGEKVEETLDLDFVEIAKTQDDLKLLETIEALKNLEKDQLSTFVQFIVSRVNRLAAKNMEDHTLDLKYAAVLNKLDYQCHVCKRTFKAPNRCFCLNQAHKELCEKQLRFKELSNKDK